MSYDLFLFTPVSDERPGDTVIRLEDEEEARETADPAGQRRNSRIADALLARGAGYEESGWTGGIELMDEAGLQVLLRDQHVALNFPYWDSLDAERLAREIVAVAAAVASEEAAWRLYDPQLERFIDPIHDRESFLGAFGWGLDAAKRIYGSSRA
jgi:hypothetical protein